MVGQKMKTKSPEQKDLTRDAFNDIRKMIFSNMLKPGQKIPYRKMAEGMNMSLTPIVQALKQMEYMGLVYHEKNRGFFVEKVTPQQIEEAYRLRSLIEPMMLSETIANLDEDGLKKISDAMDGYLVAKNKGSAKLMLVKDIQFHIVLAELSNQTVSILLLKYLFDFLYLRFSEELIFARPLEDSISDHAAIFKAIKRRDIDAATQALKSHILRSQKNALKGLKDRLDEMEGIIF